ILTAARPGEVINAVWDEVDPANKLWTVPGRRMKAGREHKVPLSEPALAVIDKMAGIRCCQYVFPGRTIGTALSHTALQREMKVLGTTATLHGFRSTFRDWIAERTTFSSEVAEMALAHAVGHKVEAAYRRGDLFQKCRQLADAWAKFCAAEPQSAQVLSLR